MCKASELKAQSKLGERVKVQIWRRATPELNCFNERSKLITLFQQLVIVHCELSLNIAGHYKNALLLNTPKLLNYP